MSFLFMIIVCIFGCSSSLAQGSVVFGSNMVYAIGGPDYKNDWAVRGFAVFCLLFWLVLNVVSSKNAIRANNIFTVLKVLILILLICVGFVGLSGHIPNQPDLSLNFSFKGTLKNPGSYANAIYYVISAYAGWSNLNFVMDELVDPIRNLPRCAVTAVSLVTLLYFLANVAYLSVLSIDTIIHSNATVASNIFSTAFGGVFGSRILPMLTGLSSFGAMGASFYAGSRIALEAARKGYLPYDHFFSKVNPRFQTPMHSLILLFFISLIFLLAPPPGAVFTFIVAFSGYGNHFFSGMAVLGLLIMRKTQPNIKRPIKAPIAVSILFIGICIFTLAFVFIPPTYFSNPYPYWLPYVVTIAIAVMSIGLWYYRVVYSDALSKSYNA
ncbi:amino acid/polyamine transporter I, partial [Sporodiniella umbellata]